MMDNSNSHRKIDHMMGAHDLWKNTLSNGFDEVHFIHNALPETNIDQIDMHVSILGRDINYPFMITAMTGGHPDLGSINHILGEIAAKYNIPVEVGSQRVAVEDPALIGTFAAIRKNAPNAFIIGNIGVVQLIEATDPLELVETCIEMIRANAISIHLNSMQELFQLEGTSNFNGALAKIQEVAKNASVPVIVKEVGGGISGLVAGQLENAGASAINVAGFGGTNFNQIEFNRQQQNGKQNRAKDSDSEDPNLPPWGELLQWGIPTVVSLRWVRNHASLPIIGSGGVRSGVDLAKTISLGATIGGICGALLPALFSQGIPPFEEGQTKEIMQACVQYIDQFILQFKITMAGLGCMKVEEMATQPIVFFGTIKEWLENLGLFPDPRLPKCFT